MANLTNEQIVDLYEGLNEISEDKELKFKATISFSLAKNKSILRPFYESVIETRQQLFDKYGEEKEDGIFIPNENFTQFKTEFESLMNIKNYIGIENIPLNELDNERIGIQLMEKILPIIEKKARV